MSENPTTPDNSEGPNQLLEISQKAAKIRRAHAENQEFGFFRESEEESNDLAPFLSAVRSGEITVEDAARDIGTIITELRRQAERDPLTGLLNGRTFNRRLEKEMKLAESTGQPLSVVFLDIDNFKEYNEAFGHLLTNKLLQAISVELKQHILAFDEMARFGGDEFVMALPGARASVAKEAIEKMMNRLPEVVLETLRKEVEGEISEEDEERKQSLVEERVIGMIDGFKNALVDAGKDVPEDKELFSFSSGVHEYQKGEDKETLLKHANENEKAAKAAGKNQVFDDTKQKNS